MMDQSEHGGSGLVSSTTDRQSPSVAEPRAMAVPHLRTVKSIEPWPDRTTLPLSFAQERLWTLTQLTPQSTEYVIPVALQLSGSLNVEGLEYALNAIVARHEVLRTRYAAEANEPVQLIDAAGPVVIEQVDLSGLDSEEQRRRLDAVTANEIGRRFDLGEGPVLRISLVRLAQDEHVLLIVVHHIAFDGWSMAVLVRELGQLYAAFVEGRPASLAPLAIQYADFAMWQREWLTGEVLQRQGTYWREKLNGVSPLELPADRPRPSVRTAEGASVTFEIPQALGQALIELGRQRKATPFMVFLAAFQALLARYSGQTDIAVGTPIAGRNRSEVQDLIGCFVNTLVIRTDLSDDPSFITFLDQVRATALDAYDHQDLPFERLVQELQPDRDLSRNPLFQVMLLFRHAEDARCVIGSLLAKEMPVPSSVAKFDLTLQVEQRQDATFSLGLKYATALFDQPTIEQFAAHYVQLLKSVAAQPSQTLSKVILLTEFERRLVLEDWNRTHAAWPHDSLVHDLVEAQVKRAPDAVAVVFEDARLTYGELNRRANQLAHYLRGEGIRPQTPVAIYMERSLEMVVGLLGILKAGATYVPVDSSIPSERLAFILNDVNAPILLTQHKFAHILPDRCRAVHLDRNWPKIAPHSDRNPDVALTPNHPTYIMYTSGSTGAPKGVQLSHRGICNRLLWMQQTYHLTPDDRVLQKTPFTFDVSVWEFFWPLITGAVLVLAKPEGHRDPEYLVSLIKREAITTVHFVPSMLEAFLEHPAVSECTTLRRVICSGEALSPRLQEQFFSCLRTELHNLYGPTEASIDVTSWVCHRGASGERVPIGAPIANTTMYVLDRHLQPVPIGLPGELHIGGMGLAHGYVNRPDLTAEKFIPNPFSVVGGERLYKTGDIARYRRDGQLEFLGRLDSQVKLHGFRVELAEIEAMLASHPSIKSAAVGLRTMAGNHQELVAYVVLKNRRETSALEFERYLRRQLPPYMVPSSFTFMQALPLTASGKLNRKALPVPDVSRSFRRSESTLPRTPFESIVARVWAEVLGRNPISIQDNFFSLGGDSIRAIRTVGLLRQQGVHISVMDLFRHQTIAELSELPRDTAGRNSEAVQVRQFALVTDADRHKLPMGIQDAYPLSMVQAGMLYEMLADTHLNLYHNVTSYLISDDAPFSFAAFREAANHLAKRHEALRTSFDLDSYSEPLQLVHEAALIEIVARDVRHLTTEQQRAVIAASIQADRGKPFDIGRPPLLRLAVHLVGATTWRLSWTECHAILDGWSHNSMLMELLTSYRTFRDGNTPRNLDAGSVRIADFIALERRALLSDDSEKFWRDRIQSFAKLELPKGWGTPSGAADAFCEARERFPGLQDGLRKLADEARAPLKTVLLAAHLKVMSMVSNQRSFFTGLVSNGRPEVPGSDDVKGLFLNTVPFGIDLEKCRTWGELVRATFDEEIKLWSHRRFPLPAMQRRWGKNSTLIDVAFAYLDFHILDPTLVNRAETNDISLNEFALFVTVGPDMLIVTARSSRVNAQQCARLAAMYRTVLQAMAVDVDGNAQRAYLPSSEHTRRSSETIPFDSDPVSCLLHEWVERQAESNAHRTAIVCGRQKLTYRELNERANQLARVLRIHGVGPETLVGVCLERSAEMLVGLLAVLKAGAAYVPLDPTYPPERLVFIVQDTSTRVLLTQAQLSGPFRGRVPCIICVDRDFQTVNQQETSNLTPTADLDNLAYVIHTSGSTGRPKGVMVSNRALVNVLGAMREEIGLVEDDVFAAVTTISFDIAAVELYLPLLVGACVVIIDREDASNGEALARYVSESGATIMQATPASWRLLLDVEWRPDRPFKILCGGETLTEDLARRLRQTGAELWNLYGPTEATVWTTLEHVQDVKGPIPLGQPMSRMSVSILNAALDPVPMEVSGELFIGGVGVARGYLHRPDLTAERFLPDPWAIEPGSRLYRTGDVVRAGRDGSIDFLGRSDTQVKVRGFRIELGEIEGRLLQHPAISHVVVIVRDDPSEEKRLSAHFTLKPGMAVTAAELREHISRMLPSYMVPSSFVTVDAFPLSPSGKIDRQALSRMRPDHSEFRATYAPPRSPAETYLAHLFEEVLGIHGVGIHDDFFEIGGHSLAMMRVIVKARRERGLQLSFRDLLEHSTVATLSAFKKPFDAAPTTATVEEDRVLSVPPTPPEALTWLRREGRKLPLFCVHPGGGSGHWYRHMAERMDSTRPIAAFEWPGLYQDMEPPSSVGTIATIYLSALRRAQANGKYLLFAWCAGSPIAFELARALVAAGEEVSLFLLDPIDDGALRVQLAREIALFERCESLFQSLQRTSGDVEAQRYRRSIGEILRGVLPPDSQVDDDSLEDIWPRRVRVWRQLGQAIQGYEYALYPGKLQVLVSDELASQLSSEGLDDTAYRTLWLRRALGGAHMHRIAGDHFGVLKPPDVNEFVRILESVMPD
jgi:amino acid adenylation domain-containing protein